jgi:hypothetical protein
MTGRIPSPEILSVLLDHADLIGEDHAGNAFLLVLVPEPLRELLDLHGREREDDEPEPDEDNDDAEPVNYSR